MGRRLQAVTSEEQPCEESFEMRDGEEIEWLTTPQVPTF